ncbi:MAG: hypothetical protein KAX19_09865 [Candidatus Brocadiae bacterium]|nr:hypothetical protein [Candidatus Brocadiia bacterium]
MSPFGRLAAFLSGLGVRFLVLDSELESNQVRDVLETLWSVRGRLRRGAANWLDSSLGRNMVCGAPLIHDAGRSPGHRRPTWGA